MLLYIVEELVDATLDWPSFPYLSRVYLSMNANTPNVSASTLTYIHPRKIQNILLYKRGVIAKAIPIARCLFTAQPAEIDGT